MNFYPGGNVVIGAKIATNIEATISEFVTDKSHIMIVGGDGANVNKSASDSQYPWVPMLKRWTTGGAEVDYLFQNPSAETMSYLRKEFSAVHNMRIRVVNEIIENEDVAHSAKKLETLHFLIVDEDGHDNAVWIEPNHEIGKTETDAQYFTPTNVSVISSTLGVFRTVFKDIFNNYSHSI